MALLYVWPYMVMACLGMAVYSYGPKWLWPIIVMALFLAMAYVRGILVWCDVVAADTEALERLPSTLSLLTVVELA